MVSDLIARAYEAGRGEGGEDAKAKEQNLTGPARAAFRQARAGPVLAAFADWVAGQRPRLLPKSALGEAITYAMNQ